MPKSAGDVLCSTSLMRSIKELYPDFELYFATERKYFDLLKGNPFIDKIIEYKVEMNNIFYSEIQIILNIQKREVETLVTIAKGKDVIKLGQQKSPGTSSFSNFMDKLEVYRKKY